MTPVDKKFRQKTHVFLQPIEGTLEPQGVKIAQFALLFTKLTPLLPVRLGVGLFVFGDSKHDVFMGGSLGFPEQKDGQGG